MDGLRIYVRQSQPGEPILKQVGIWKYTHPLRLRPGLTIKIIAPPLLPGSVGSASIRPDDVVETIDLYIEKVRTPREDILAAVMPEGWQMPLDHPDFDPV